MMGRATWAALCLAVSLPLLMTGCAGSDEGEDGMPGRGELMEYLRAEAGDTGLPVETVDCVMNALEGLSDAELFSILQDTATTELELKVTELTSTCA